jgi:Ca-activated chloride channel family protein
MAQGILLPPDREGGGPLELRSHEVEFRVEEQAAVTKVSHTFYNPQRRQVEGMFYFPIPEGAATTEFAMWMNGERVEGSVLPKDEARQTYERIVRRLRDPGLLEYVNGTLFQARIFPIPARGEQTVEIEYATTLERDGNVIHFQYPVHADSNFVATNFVVNGSVRHSGGIAQVYSPHYNIDTDRRSADRVNVSAELSREQLTNDFELFITSSQEDIAMSVLSWDGNESDDQGYFMMSLTPSEELKELQRLPREVTFVVDTSGSMAGDKMRQARELLEYCVSELQPEDRFNIVTFSSGVDGLFDEIQPANRESKERAQRFIRNLDAAGGTNINGAMEAAMEYASSSSHAGSVFFVTDGIPTSGERDVSKILDNVARSFEDDNRRLFSFGVGYDVNTRLLDGMARRGTGRSDYVRPNQNLRAAIGSFFDSVSAPLLTDVELDFGDADVFRVYPEEPSVLYEGD